MELKCPICGGVTGLKRSFYGDIIEDYVCDKCSIAWYVPSPEHAPKIRISTTHSIASKMNDEEFRRLLKKIEEYEKFHK